MRHEILTDMWEMLQMKFHKILSVPHFIKLGLLHHNI